jgi:chemotaxis response regulator CheB
MKALIIYEDQVLKMMIGSVLNKAGIEYNFVKRSKEAIEANIEYWSPDVLIMDTCTSQKEQVLKLADEIDRQYHLPRVFFTSELTSDGNAIPRINTVVIDILYIASLPTVINKYHRTELGLGY